MSTAQLPEKYPFIQAVVLVTLIALWAVGSFLYVTWAINQAEHKWCTTFQLLNEAPAPAAAPDNPSRIYAAKLSADFRELQREFGC